MKEFYWDLQRFNEGGAAGGAPGVDGTAAVLEEAPEQEEEALTEVNEEAAAQEVTEPVSPDAEPEPDEAPEEKSEESSPAEEAHEEEPAVPAGLSVEERIAALEEKLTKQSKLLMQREQDLALRQHFSSLEKQGETLKESFPGFNLRAELKDPVFVRLTSPMVGLSVEDAYYAIHHREITEAGAQAAAEALGNSVQAGRNMPLENGGIQRGAPDGGYRPLKELSPEERRIRMDLIRSGKLTF